MNELTALYIHYMRNNLSTMGALAKLLRRRLDKISVDQNGIDDTMLSTLNIAETFIQGVNRAERDIERVELIGLEAFLKERDENFNTPNV
jgi:hypothetical protein